MSQVQNIWRQLIQRRLWPLAALLLVALVAVPVLLAKEPDPAVTAAVAPVSGNDELAAQPIVAPATAEDRDRRRRVLGDPKNPFAVARPVDEAPLTESGPTIEPGAAEVPPLTGGDTSSGAGTPPGADTGTPTPPAPDSDDAATPTYALHELTVRFGDEEGGELQRLKRLQPLPSAEAPVLIYLGASDDGKTAIFLLDKGLTAIGDGKCKPTPEQCETLHIKAGETEFFDVLDEAGAVTAQYQLDLVKIHKSTG